MTEIVNQPLTTAENVFQSTVWNNSIVAFKTWLFSAAPYLNLPVIRWIVNLIVDGIIGKFYQFIVLQVDIGYIRLANTRYHYEYTAACKKLISIANSKGIDSDEFKAAREEAAVALSKFTRVNQ